MGHEPAQMTKNLVEVALTEFAHVAHQQAKKAGDGWRADLVAKARAYLVELCDHVNKEKQPDPKPLNDFIHLFLTEAFITREDH